MEWKVIYQNAPLHYNDPYSLIVQADDLEQAIATAIDHLTRNGQAVGGIRVGYSEEKLNAYLGDYQLSGPTRIMRCEPYNPAKLGTVR